MKSLSFDINSPSGPQRPWAVHLHTGQAGPVQSSLYSPCPGRFTVQQLCTPNSTSAPRQIPATGRTPCFLLPWFLRGPRETERRSLTWNHERSHQGSSKSPETPAGRRIKSDHRLLCSTLLRVFVQREVVEQSDGSNERKESVVWISMSS